MTANIAGKKRKKVDAESRTSPARILMLVAGGGIFVALAWWAFGSSGGPSLPPGTRAEMKVVGSKTDLVDDEVLAREGLEGAYDWFDNHREKILNSASADLKKNAEPVPELWETRSGVVKVRLNHVRWERKDGKKVSDEPVVELPAEPAPTKPANEGEPPPLPD